MDGEDLVYNRRGAIGPAQRKALAETAKSYGAARYALGAAADEARAWLDTIEKDLADGRVEAFDGELVFQRKNIVDVMSEEPEWSPPAVRRTRLLTACLSAYAAVTNGRAPASLGVGVNPLPGRNRFYVLGRANIVVGFEMSSGGGELGQRLQAILLEVQGISEDALATNRRGMMTEAQKAAMQRASNVLYAYTTAVLVILLGAFSCWRITSAMESGKSLFDFPTIASTLLALAFALWLPFAIRDQRKSNTGGKADAAEGRVEARVGVISKSYQVHEQSLTLRLRMGEHDFDVSNRPALFAAVVEGHAYRAYVAPRSGRLVALEFASAGGVSSLKSAPG
jgi:hypothetical protein